MCLKYLWCPSCASLPFTKLYFGPKNEREKAVEEACDCLKTLESALDGKRFFGGDAIGMIDIAANFIGFWLNIIQEIAVVELLSAEKLPALFKWTDEFVKETLPPQDKLSAVFKARIDQAREAQTNAPK
ncbi:hypothetical protein V6N13_097113 [Hibiscus sabdariffa]|uniref:Glutathione S-transferase C-terminal domain-containing protein n=1 Tax=Hibiscus sabdariffa TaxID=183260 RepID=A0ABR2BYN6_9ROSI